MKVLVASAEAVSRKDLMRELKQVGLDPQVCEDAKSAWAAVQSPESPPMLFLDINLPGTQIEKFIERLRGLEHGDDYFLVLLLASKDMGEMEIASGMPVDDALGRPFDQEELQIRARSWRKIAELQFRASARASHDSLTGLWNHGLVMEVAQREIDRAGRESSPLALLVTDVDALSAINENIGAQGGDVLLRQIAERMRIALRSYDMFGRYGGGKFMVVLPKCTRANALEVAERLRKAVADSTVEFGEREVGVTVSVGVASLMPGQTVDAEKMFRAADHALFRAKQSGGNCAELAVSLKSRAGSTQ